ncbi:MAG: hypothetical protein KF812_09875, partial [Fimbriimonadaceae bacterium]|nr:hypothetical protein [Fimbriimonadaceae bacterium]
VAVEDGKPVPVPELICESREERVAFLTGRLRREIRAERTKQFDGLVAKINSFTDEEIGDLMSHPESLVTRLAIQ